MPGSFKYISAQISYQIKESEFSRWRRLDDFFVPDFDDGGMMFPVVDQPEGKLLDALLRVVQIGKLPLQCRLRVAHLFKV